MLSIFPQLLDFAFYGPTVLRVGTGLFLLAVAYQIAWGARQDTLDIMDDFPKFKPQWFFIGKSVVVTSIVAILMIVGLFTQIASIIAILISIKLVILGKIYDRNFGFSLSTYLLIIVIQIALLVMGPGALALDLPL